MSVDAEDEFQKELITLFVQEAQEWLQQVHVSLDELQQSPPPERHTKLAQTMTAGLANLGGSAATINLRAVEQATFAALPLVKAVENPAAPPSAGAFLALCKQLGQIQTALTHATGVTFDEESVKTAPLPATISTQALLASLRKLQSARAIHTALPCQATDMLIAQVEGMIKNGVAECDAASLREFLGRAGEAEQAFARRVDHKGTSLIEGIEKMKSTPAERWQDMTEHWRAMADQVGELWSASQQVNAVPAMTFFMGLQSFATIVLHGRVMPAVPQFDRVEAKLREMLALVQDWAEAGRRERSTIDALLPAA
ncbi:MAG: hypothetical protein U0412_04090 [Nitrospira sp.]